jgi:hypothetical protein
VSMEILRGLYDSLSSILRIGEQELTDLFQGFFQ